MASLINFNGADIIKFSNLMNRFDQQITQSTERIFSGYKLNRGADGPADLIKANQLSTQIRSNSVAITSIQEGSNVLNIADSALGSIEAKIQEMRTLVSSLNSGSPSASEKTEVENQIAALVEDIDSIASGTTFNGKALLDGSIYNGGAGSYKFQTGINSGDFLDIAAAFKDNSASTLNVDGLQVQNQTQRDNAIADIDAALDLLAENRGYVSQYTKSLESREGYLTGYNENLASAESRLRDADLATEALSLSQTQIRRDAVAGMFFQQYGISDYLLALL